MRMSWIVLAAALLAAACMGLWASGALQPGAPTERAPRAATGAADASLAAGPTLQGAVRTPPPADGSHLVVRVLDARTGRPLQGAQVTWHVPSTTEQGLVPDSDLPEGRRLTGVTDASGRAGAPCPHAGEAWVNATASGHQPDTCRVLDGVREVVLRLVPHGWIEGRIVSADDKRPVAGLNVTCDLLGPEAVPVVSAADGTFRLPDLPPSMCTVRAQGAGLASLPCGSDDVGVRVVVQPGQGTQVEVPVGPAARIEGRVLLPDGGPAAGADVWLQDARWAWHARRIGGVTLRCDRDGRFRFDSVPRLPGPSSVRVCARAPGTAVGTAELGGTWDDLCYEAASSEPDTKGTGASLERIAPAQHKAPVEVRLPVPGTYVIDVRDADSGQPVPGATVTLVGNVPAFEGLTDARGMLDAAGLTPGKVEAHAQAPGYRQVRSYDQATGREVPVLVIVPGQSGRATLHVRRTCTIRASVQWADGTPLDGPPLVLEVEGQKHGTHFWTDVGSAFARTDLPWDTYTVSIWAGLGCEVSRGPDGEPILYARATLGPDTFDAVLRSQRSPPPRLRLTVLDATGAPLPDGRLRAHLATRKESWESGLDRYDEPRVQQGRAELPGVDRPLWLEVTPGAGPDVAAAITRVGPIAPGQAELTLRLEPGHAIAGRLTGPAGVALGGIQVEAWIETQAVPEAWHQSPFATVASAPDGTFRLEQLPAGRYTIYARVERGLAPAPEIEVDAGRTDVVLALVRRVSARVTVVLPDGTPTQDAKVAVYIPPWLGGDGAAHAPCGNGGTAVLHELDPREAYLLEVENRHPDDERRVWRVPGWTPGDTTVRLPARTRLAVQVVDEAGITVHGAAVVLAPVSSPTACTAAHALDEEGRALFIDPPPGPWTAVASLGTRIGPPQPIDGEARLARLVLPRSGGRLVVALPSDVTVAAATGPAPDAPHWILWDDAEPNAQARGALGVEGRLELEGLRPDRTYTCLLRDPRPGGFVALAAGVAPDGRLQRARLLGAKEVRLTLEESPIAYVRAISVVETREEARSDGDDGYLLPALPPGRYTLRIQLERRSDRSPLEVAVPFDGEHAPRVRLPGR